MLWREDAGGMPLPWHAPTERRHCAPAGSSTARESRRVSESVFAIAGCIWGQR